MLHWLIAMFWALACPNHSSTTVNHDSHQIIVLDDTGGDTGPIPPTGPPHK